MTGALSLFPAGSLASVCLTAAHLYTLEILQPTCRRCPLPQSTCTCSRFVWPRHYSRLKRDLALRRLLPILLQQPNHHSGPSVNRLTSNHGLLE